MEYHSLLNFYSLQILTTSDNRRNVDFRCLTKWWKNNLNLLLKVTMLMEIVNNVFLHKNKKTGYLSNYNNKHDLHSNIFLDEIAQQ